MMKRMRAVESNTEKVLGEGVLKEENTKYTNKKQVERGREKGKEGQIEIERGGGRKNQLHFPLKSRSRHMHRSHCENVFLFSTFFDVFFSLCSFASVSAVIPFPFSFHEFNSVVVVLQRFCILHFETVFLFIQ